MTQKATSFAAHISSANRVAEVPPVLFLEVARGKTQFPSRPVYPGRFLIGAGERCELRLGGDGIPLIHSVIYVEDQDIWLDAIVSVPPLKRNGEIVTSTCISDGDVIEIGEFRFVARRNSAAPTQRSDEDTPSGQQILQHQNDDLSEVPLEDLSAAELVELIESDMNLVEEFEEGRLMGAASLLHEVLARGDAAEIDENGLLASPALPNSPATSTDHHQNRWGEDEDPLLPQVERVITQLNEFSMELEQRAERLTRREASFTEAASLLFEAQQKLDLQLETLDKHLETLDVRPSEPFRKVA